MGLSLSRKVGEKIYIGTATEQVELEIIRVRGGKVIICIEAPHDVRIRRGEVKQRDEARSDE